MSVDLSAKLFVAQHLSNETSRVHWTSRLNVMKGHETNLVDVRTFFCCIFRHNLGDTFSDLFLLHGFGSVEAAVLVDTKGIFGRILLSDPDKDLFWILSIFK
jgi:hypothetical protein